ncbi:MAG TPA: nucleotidyltransferase domain-containing protein [Gelria sp.]|nr:nucleotidyltransferase domain-containing protein [Gelria sp.]
MIKKIIVIEARREMPPYAGYLDPYGINWYYEYRFQTIRGLAFMARLSIKLDKIKIEDKLPALGEFFDSRKEILAVYLFGSYGTEFQTNLSDIDLAILVSGSVTPDLAYQLDLSAQLADIIQEEDIDVVVLNTASVVMQFEVLSTGKLLFERNHELVCDFLERVLKEYGDFQIDLKQFYYDYDDALRKKAYGR